MPDRTAELYYGGAWQPVSIREAPGVEITRGVTAEGTRAEPTQARLTLDNRDGALSPRNPLSPLYGAGRNTPFRLAVNAGGPYFSTGTTTYTLSTPDSASLDIPGDIDVRLDAASTNWASTTWLVSRFATNHLCWSLEMSSLRQLRFRWSPTGATGGTISATSTAAVPATGPQRLVLRATLDVNDGAGGCVVRFYYGTRRDGTLWTMIGEPVVFAGTTTLWTGTAPVLIGGSGPIGPGQLRGTVYGLQVRNGINGSLVVDMDTAAHATVGTSSWTDGTGRVWTRTGSTSALTNRHVRLEGEVPDWPQERDLPGRDKVVPITPSGITRRLDSGKKPLDSALRRFIAAQAPVQCWPLTDGEQASRGESLVGATPMRARTGGQYVRPEWGEGTIASWVEPTVSFARSSGTRLVGSVPNHSASAGGWSVDLFRSGPGELEQLFIYDRGAGTDAQNRHMIQLVFQAPLDKILILRESTATDSSSGASLGSVDGAGIYDGRPHHVRVDTVITGGITDWAVSIDGVMRQLGSMALTMRPLSHIEYESTPGTNDHALGYVTVMGPTRPSEGDMYDALMGFTGEGAGDRVLRLCAERGITASMHGPPGKQMAVGIQKPARFLDTLQTAAAADLGYLLERRDARELVYRSRASLYNQDPVLTLDWATGIIGAPFRPLGDDKLTENEVSVTRDGGVTSTATLDTGRMSTQDPPDGVGLYDVAYTRSLDQDGDTRHLAGWMLHLGTYDGLRVTALTLQLGNPRVRLLLADILRVDVGDTIRLINIPEDYGPDALDLIVRGYTERLETDWRITFRCTPGEPWTVAVVDDGDRSRVNTGGSTLAVGVSAGATSLSVATATGPIWTTTPAHFPFTIAVGGERMTVTNITGSSSPQTFTVVRAVNGVAKAHSTGAAVALAQPAAVPL